MNYIKHTIEKPDWQNRTPSEKTQEYREVTHCTPDPKINEYFASLCYISMYLN